MTCQRGNRRCGARTGNVAIMIAVLLPLLMGMVGFAIDGGLLMTRKRDVQAAADAAAMAGACIFYQNYAAISSLNSFQNPAKDAAIHMAASNGYLNNASGSNPAGDTSVVTVNFPPNITNNSIYNSGAADPNYDMNLNSGVIEVIIQYYQPVFFTKVWGYNTVSIGARAVARGAWVSPKNGVLLLNYTVAGSLTDKGGGSSGGIIVTGGSFVVDSNSSSAVIDTGGGVITAPEFDVTGGVSAPSSGIVTTPTSGNVMTGLHPTPDPFAYLQQTAANQYNALQSGTVTGSGSQTDPYVFQAGYSYPSFSANSNPTYVKFTGSGMIGMNGFSVNNVVITQDSGSTGVVLYNNSGQLNMQGSPSGDMSWSGVGIGPANSNTANNPLQGFAIWQPTTNTTEIKLAGNGTATIKGTVYAPTAQLTVTGNGSATNLGSQYVTSTMHASGNGNVDINYSGPNAAKARLLCLIE